MGRIKNDFDALEELEALRADLPFEDNHQNEQERKDLEEKIKTLSSYFFTSTSFPKKEKRIPLLTTPQKCMQLEWIVLTTSVGLSNTIELDEFSGIEDLEGISLLDESVAHEQSFSDQDFDLFSPLKLESPDSKKNKSVDALDDDRPTKK